MWDISVRRSKDSNRSIPGLGSGVTRSMLRVAHMQHSDRLLMLPLHVQACLPEPPNGHMLVRPIPVSAEAKGATHWATHETFEPGGVDFTLPSYCRGMSPVSGLQYRRFHQMRCSASLQAHFRCNRVPRGVGTFVSVLSTTPCASVLGHFSIPWVR